MWIGIVVILCPYEWKVTGLNLVRGEIDFIFAKWSYRIKCERAKVKSIEGAGNHYIMTLLIEIKPP